MKKLLQLFSVLAAAGGVTATAFAVAPVHQNDQYEIRLPQYDLFYYSTPQIEQARQAVATSIQNELGGQWKVYEYNSQAKSARSVIGSGFETGMPVATSASAELAGRMVLEQNAAALGLQADNLVFKDVTRGNGKAAVHFEQDYDGIPVVGGRAHATFMEATGRVFVMGADYYNGIDLDTNPTLSQFDAERIAQLAVPFDPAVDQPLDDASLLVLPVPVTEESVTYHLVWRVKVATNDPLGVWVTDVDAHTGEIVQRMNDIHFVDYVGNSQADIQHDTYCNGSAIESASYMDIDISGTGGTTSDENGDFVVAFGGSGSATITAELFGPYVNVNWVNGSDASFSGTITAGTPFTLEFNDSNSRKDERDVFEAVNDIHDYFELFDPGWGRTNARISANVDMNGSCNAFYNGTINFYPQSGGCANTGEIQGVVHHEYGHGVQASLIGGQGNQGLGEGNSDVLANILTQESIIGRGFNLNCSTGLRDSDNTLVYPDDLGGGVHSDGRIIAGFHWDAMMIFQDLMGIEAGTLQMATDWHFGRKVDRPTFQVAQVLATFVANDDDGNLANGTPHYDVYCEAALNHGFTCPSVTEGVLITHDPERHKQRDGDFDIDATINATDAALAFANIVYRVDDGPWQTVAMANVGGNDYEGTITGLVDLNSVDYYIEAEDANGLNRTTPGLAPFKFITFDICQSYTAMESTSGWVVDAEGEDDAVRGAWENVVPIRSPIAPGEDVTPGTGTRCWVTENGPEGGFAGQGDIDFGSTSLYSPVFDMSGASQLVVKYEKWFSNETGGGCCEDPWEVFVRNNGGPWLEVENTLDPTDGWETFEFDLMPLLGTPEDIEFKFRASDNNTQSQVDAAIDEFRILGVLNSADAPDPTGTVARFALHGATPNPTLGATRIGFQVPVSARVDIRLFDVSGREVANLANGNFDAGSHEVEWNGKDGNGNVVPAGVYYMNMVSNEYNVSKRLVRQ